MRIIAHLDLDAFFASVEEREHPRLKGLPIVVGADPMDGHGRGVVSTANYKAREYGIHSALPISQAWEFSQKAKKSGLPEAVFLTGSFRKYSEVSHAVMEIVRKYSDVTEQASVDEAYIDLSPHHLTKYASNIIKNNNEKWCGDKSQCGNFTAAEKICRKIKQAIKDREKITASIGLSVNKLVAKIASDMQKPDGLTIILPDQIENFLNPLSIRKIPGIGPKTEQLLNKLKIYKVGDLKKYSKMDLEEMLGKWGASLHYKIRGLDNSPVAEDFEVKSIGEQETFQQDTLDFKTILERMEALCLGVFHSFQKSDFKKFKTITITVRFADFNTKNRSHTLKKSAKTLKAIKVETMKLLMPFFDDRENPRRKKIRLVGVRIEKLA